ncbi:MAG TPA: T9SS type A sorting domain-containing protein [Chitinophagaceae bacterium]|nr:T9SS type A sorting domain-containing protein [Chitinophagaceae bacterium]
MKSKPNFTKFLHISTTALALCLLLMQPVFALAAPGKKKETELLNNDPSKDKPAKKGKSPSRDQASVKVYPDPLKKIMHVVAKQNKGKEVDFFVFDLEGTLVLNYKMKSRDHQRIVGLPKGSYVYNVFCGDIQTASGNFEIK